MVNAGVIAVPGPEHSGSRAPSRAVPVYKDTARLPFLRDKLCNKSGGGPVMIAVPQKAVRTEARRGTEVTTNPQPEYL